MSYGVSLRVKASDSCVHRMCTTISWFWAGWLDYDGNNFAAWQFICVWQCLKEQSSRTFCACGHASCFCNMEAISLHMVSVMTCRSSSCYRPCLPFLPAKQLLNVEAVLSKLMSGILLQTAVQLPVMLYLFEESNYSQRPYKTCCNIEKQ